MKDGYHGYAFPSDGAFANGHPEGGLTKREYFAAKALQGILASSKPISLRGEPLKTEENHAEAAVIYADALLSALAEDAAQGGV